MYHKKYYLNIIKKLTVPPMVFSFPKAVLFFFQGKEVIDLVYSILYSETKRRKKEMRKKMKREKERPRDI